MYTFHAGWQPQLLKDCIRGWQHVQLLGGTALAAASLIYCAHPFLTDVLADAVPPVLYLTYYYLFQQELAEEARKNGSTRKEK